MSMSELHDWEYEIDRCCRENLAFEMREIAEDIYSTAYVRGKNAKEWELLEQEPCGDCISRQAVLDAVSNPLNIRLEEIIKKLPYAKPLKIGFWKRATDKTGHLVWECDNCRWQQRFYTNYCPDCGARMSEEESEE